jgi:O-antigen/teichoic acid export membrane protein
MAIALGIRLFYNAFGVTLIVIDRVWKLTFISLADAPITLAGAILLVPHWGAKGLALSFLLSSIVVFLLFYRSSMREMAWEKPSKIGIVLTIMAIISALLINTIKVLWLSVSATIVLLFVMSVTIIFLAKKYDLLGEVSFMIPFLRKIK